ncbi:MAG TPA: copper amine oxidase N-terminal domain-containing protein, partial [Fimbriimonas sp.]|nr:copper amine oxidase N-terminal domain-containing protein [Fimbriimonas sp.]
MKGLNKLASLAVATAFAGLAGAQGITVFVNGDPVQFNGAGARQIQGRVMVPLRGVMEKLGAYVSYLGESKTVIASKGDVDMQLRIGESFALVNGQRRTLDVPAMVYAGTTMVPLRFMSEALGAQVSWDAPAMAVRIETPSAANPVPPTTGTRPQPINNGPVVIRSLDMDRSGYRRSGDRVIFTLDGTPGGQAVMQIPGLTGEIPMSEVEPG